MTVNVSPELATAKTISSLEVSGSIANVNWYVFAGDSVTPPRSAAPVPEATLSVVWILVICADRVVSTEIELYSLIIMLPSLY
jgi:hypothetical protein